MSDEMTGGRKISSDKPVENPGHPETGKIDRLVRTAVLLTVTGMLLVLVFLITGFRAWSVGLGVFLGIPVMIVGVILYVAAVIRDLRYRKVLDDDIPESRD